MFVDCMACPVRGPRCDDCAVTVLGLGALPSAGHRALTGPLLSAGPQWSAGRACAAEPELTPGVQLDAAGFQLDAAEDRVVSIFVGAGLVSARAAARLLARRERVPSFENVREVG